MAERIVLASTPTSRLEYIAPPSQVRAWFLITRNETPVYLTDDLAAAWHHFHGTASPGPTTGRLAFVFDPTTGWHFTDATAARRDG